MQPYLQCAQYLVESRELSPFFGEALLRTNERGVYGWTATVGRVKNVMLTRLQDLTDKGLEELNDIDVLCIKRMNLLGHRPAALEPSAKFELLDI